MVAEAECLNTVLGLIGKQSEVRWVGAPAPTLVLDDEDLRPQDIARFGVLHRNRATARVDIAPEPSLLRCWTIERRSTTPPSSGMT